MKRRRESVEGGFDVAGICPFHLPPDIFGHGTSVEEARWTRADERGNRPGRKVILHLLRDEVPSRRLFSVCSPAN